VRVAAVILTRDGELRATIAELTEQIRLAATEGMLTDAVRRYIMATLGETNWVLGGPKGAAAKLGLNRMTLLSKMRKLGISRQATKTNRERVDLFSRAHQSSFSMLA
jgi:formate hydrogenlyase transcriptional activator